MGTDMDTAMAMAMDTGKIILIGKRKRSFGVGGKSQISK